MRIAPHRRASGLSLMRLRVNSAPCLKNVPGQDRRCDDGTHKFDPLDNGGRLIYRRVHFVVGGFGKISLRNRRDAYHGAH
jgi:hypothetical protein